MDPMASDFLNDMRAATQPELFGAITYSMREDDLAELRNAAERLTELCDREQRRRRGEWEAPTLSPAWASGVGAR
jgi:hypothetical protein